MPIVPLASEVLIDILSDAFFIWTLYPQSSFWVNLNPTQADQVIERNLGLTGVGRILLESDLMLKKTTARLLHPDNPVAGPLSLFFLKDKMFLSLFFTWFCWFNAWSWFLGSRFWEQLYSEVGITSFKLCHTFRQWIVPGVAEVQLQSSCDILEGCEHREHALPGSSSRQSLLHVVHASLRIHQETDYMIGDNEQPQIGRESGPTQQTCNYTDKIVQK